MKIIGLTGGIGSGKSAAIRMLESDFGARVMLADDIGHLAMKQGTQTYLKMVDTFGEKILKPDAEIDRAVLAGMLLSSAEMMDKQNKIVHPFVIDAIKSQLTEWRNESVDLAVIESAILVETECDKLCDEVWLITAPTDVRIRRLMSYRGYDYTRAEYFMRRQQSEEEYRDHCDRVICNDGDIENLYKELTKCVEQLIPM